MKSKIYEEFVEKFKSKKTTDDCYTPPKVYKVILDWVCKEYNIDKSKVCRPFYPGGDYQNFNYSNDTVVVDNPPFSILAQIKRFYIERNIKFFLFAPTLTIFNCDAKDLSFVVTDTVIEYENGAKVKTAFITNLEDCKIRISAELDTLIKETQKKTNKLKKYDYPINLLTVSKCSKLVQQLKDYKISKEDVIFIRSLDKQREKGLQVYGGGFLISDFLAGEIQKEIQKKDNVIVVELSEREKEIVRSLGR